MEIKIGFPILFLVLVVVTNYYGSVLSRGLRIDARNPSSAKAKRIIINTDPGLDDYYALLILFYAEKQGLVKIEGIVCSQGNANIMNVVKNTVRLIELLERYDIPLYRGIDDPIILHALIYPYFGDDGFGDLTYNKDPDVKIVKTGLAAKELYERVTKNPGEISLICLGPLTDIAITLKLYSDFSRHLKDMYILGGNFIDANQGGVSTEYNFLSDPEAAHIVFEVPANTTYLYPLESFTKPTISFDWRFNVLGSKTKTMKLATRAERSLNHELLQPYWGPTDAFLAFCFLFSEHCQVADTKPLTVELRDLEKKGWLIRKDTGQTSNIKIYESMDQEEFKKYMLEVGTYL